MRRPPGRPVRRGRPKPPGRTLLVVHARELLTVGGSPEPRRREAASDLGIVEDGAVYAEGDRIVEVGPTKDVVRRHPRAHRTVDASGKVVMPGFVDAHTHTIFAGSREHEVEWKAQGLSYSEIASRGGGILETVQATRRATEEDLVRSGADRLRTMLGQGTTTVEVKSGYGLRTADELKILRAAKRAGARAETDVVRTFLGAHAIPPEFAARRGDYVTLLAQESLEAIASERAATFCDAFVEHGYFDAEEARTVFRKAATLGLGIKLHADELTDGGGAALAAEMHATSADHLLHASGAGIEAMARSGVVAVLLPGTSLASRMPFADGRRLIAAGVPVALGTDFNPNCWCESMQLVIALACHHNGLLPSQAIVAATINAAHAIGLADRVGSLEVGKQADLLVLDIPSYRHLGYRLGGNAVAAVVKRGRVMPPLRPAGLPHTR